MCNLTEVKTYLSFSPNSSVESAERHYLLLCYNIFEISVGLPDVHSLERESCFTGVLKVHAEVGAPCLARFRCIIGISRVPSHSCAVSPTSRVLSNLEFILWKKQAYIDMHINDISTEKNNSFSFQKQLKTCNMRCNNIYDKKNHDYLHNSHPLEHYR